MEIGNVVKLKEKSLYYQMYEHDTFEIEKDWDKKHWVIRGLGPIAFLWLIIPKNEIEVVVYTYNEKKLLDLYRKFFKKMDLALIIDQYDDCEGTHDFETLECKLEDSDCYMLIDKEMKKIRNAIIKAQKQEKLLEQYKKVASAIVRTSIEQPIYVIRESEREMVEQSFNRIKELENESNR